MQVNPYIFFNGNCRQAFTFYNKVLGGELGEMITVEDMPNDPGMESEWGDMIMHTRLILNDRIIMGSDTPPQDYKPAQGMFVQLELDTPEEAERVFNGLSENGDVQMPIQEVPWAHRFGMLVDQFGTPWMVNCDKSK